MRYIYIAHAATHQMTPAIDTVTRTGIEFRVLEYDHDPRAESYGTEAAEKLALPPSRVFKTLCVSSPDGELAVAILPVTSKLNLKRAARALGVKKVTMAKPQDVERNTGYVLGGVSPLGQKRKLSTVIDESALTHNEVFVSAGKRGVEIGLAPRDLVSLCQAATAPLCD